MGAILSRTGRRPKQPSTRSTTGHDRSRRPSKDQQVKMSDGPREPGDQTQSTKKAQPRTASHRNVSAKDQLHASQQTKSAKSVPRAGVPSPNHGPAATSPSNPAAPLDGNQAKARLVMIMDGMTQGYLATKSAKLPPGGAAATSIQDKSADRQVDTMDRAAARAKETQASADHMSKSSRHRAHTPSPERSKYDLPPVHVHRQPEDDSLERLNRPINTNVYIGEPPHDRAHGRRSPKGKGPRQRPPSIETPYNPVEGEWPPMHNQSSQNSRKTSNASSRQSSSEVSPTAGRRPSYGNSSPTAGRRPSNSNSSHAAGRRPSNSNSSPTAGRQPSNSNGRQQRKSLQTSPQTPTAQGVLPMGDPDLVGKLAETGMDVEGIENFMRASSMADDEYDDVGDTEELALDNLQSVSQDVQIRTIGKIQRWQRGNMVGKGSYGKVFLGMNSDTGELFVVKQVLFVAQNQSQVDEEVLQLEQEIALLGTLQHEHIVQYLGTERNYSTNELSIFLEHMPGGSIADIVARFGSLQEVVIKKYTREVLSGLAYLHKRGIIHRDIKGQNILVDNRGVCKLADFGASRYLQTADSAANLSFKGTPVFMSPEVIMEQKYSKKSDIWSLGCTVLQMATGNPPFSEFSNHIAALFHITSTTEPPPVPDSLSEEAKEFVLKCFIRELAQRPYVEELQKHPFVRKTSAITTPNTMPTGSTAEGTTPPALGGASMHSAPTSVLSEEAASPRTAESGEVQDQDATQGHTVLTPTSWAREYPSKVAPLADVNQDDDALWQQFKREHLKQHKVVARLRKDRNTKNPHRGHHGSVPNITALVAEASQFAELKKFTQSGS